MNFGQIDKVPSRYIFQTIEVNITALCTLSDLFFKHLVAKNDTKRKYALMNISSVAGEGPIAWNTVYAASKAFVTSVTIGLGYEAKDYLPNLDVMNLTPSTTFTSMPDGVDLGMSYGILGLPTEKVARRALGKLGTS